MSQKFHLCCFQTSFLSFPQYPSFTSKCQCCFPATFQSLCNNLKSTHRLLTSGYFPVTVFKHSSFISVKVSRSAVIHDAGKNVLYPEFRHSGKKIWWHVFFLTEPWQAFSSLTLLQMSWRTCLYLLTLLAKSEFSRELISMWNCWTHNFSFPCTRE